VIISRVTPYDDIYVDVCGGLISNIYGMDRDTDYEITQRLVPLITYVEPSAEKSMYFLHAETFQEK
jgi:hypothetical protein